MDTLVTFSGSFDLARWPRQKKDPLRAWDAADEYLLNFLAEQKFLLANPAARALIINDTHGALVCALHAFNPLSWSDSYISLESARQNYVLNELGMELRALHSTEALDSQFDLVLVRVPKTTALLEDQLAKLASHLHSRSLVVAAGMVKHLQKSAFSSFEKYVGPVTTSLAVKKARLIFAEVDQTLAGKKSPFPTQYIDEGLTLSNHANVFSREQLDQGSRFLLSQYSALPAARDVIDLACGNGILGIRYQSLHESASVQFIDESYMAIASTRENFSNAFPGLEDHAQYFVSDGLSGHSAECADLILCNPPFHQQHVIGERIANEMFRDSKRCLRRGGELWVVANRHLPHAESLKRLFGQCRLVGSNKKFNVLRAKKR